jgi:hypothetical protein
LQPQLLVDSVQNSTPASLAPSGDGVANVRVTVDSAPSYVGNGDDVTFEKSERQPLKSNEVGGTATVKNSCSASPLLQQTNCDKNLYTFSPVVGQQLKQDLLCVTGKP